MNAKNQIYAGEDAWNIVAGADKVYIASGKKIIEFNPTSTKKEEILPKITGRTGNLRAPTLKRGNIVYVGYNAQMYEQIV